MDNVALKQNFKEYCEYEVYLDGKLVEVVGRHVSGYLRKTWFIRNENLYQQGIKTRRRAIEVLVASWRGV